MYGLPIVQSNDAQVLADLLNVTLVTDTAILLRLSVLRVVQNRFTPLAFDIASFATEYLFLETPRRLHAPILSQSRLSLHRLLDDPDLIFGEAVWLVDELVYLTLMQRWAKQVCRLPRIGSVVVPGS